MIEKIYEKVSCGLPVVGGGIGAFTQTNNLLQYFPEVETIIATIIISVIGATVGYITKLLLDKIFCPKKK